MKVLELFAGTRSIGKAFEEKGHEVYSVEWDKQHENPRGGMRKVRWMKDIPIYTVTYCQYGDNRMKPTDIWTNHPNPKFKPMCKNGQPCHVSAPRGSKTGTQGLKGSVLRSIIPSELCEHIVTISEEGINGSIS